MTDMKKGKNQEIQNVVCPYCEKPTNTYDLTAGACSRCRVSFAVEFYKKGDKVGMLIDERFSKFKFPIRV